MENGILFNFWRVMLIGLLATGCTALAQETIFVDAGASGAGNGTSWADAYNDLQNALNAAVSGDEIWVAAGTYYPSVEVVGAGDRYKSFQMINGVAIYGGFPSGGAGWEERAPNLYETILTGDLAGDDVQVGDPRDLPTEPTRAENSYHVVTGSGTDEMAILDGFTITAGNANGSYPDDQGGGMDNDLGSPTLNNCTFSGNSAAQGGGMFNYRSSPALNQLHVQRQFVQRLGGRGNLQPQPEPPELYQLHVCEKLGRLSRRRDDQQHDEQPND